jgi:hypothetical protein
LRTNGWKTHNRPVSVTEKVPCDPAGAQRETRIMGNGAGEEGCLDIRVGVLLVRAMAAVRSPTYRRFKGRGVPPQRSGTGPKGVASFFTS